MRDYITNMGICNFTGVTLGPFFLNCLRHTSQLSRLSTSCLGHPLDCYSNIIILNENV